MTPKPNMSGGRQHNWGGCDCVDSSRCSCDCHKKPTMTAEEIAQSLMLKISNGSISTCDIIAGIEIYASSLHAKVINDSYQEGVVNTALEMAQGMSKIMDETATIAVKEARREAIEQCANLIRVHNDIDCCVCVRCECSRRILALLGEAGER